MNDPGTDPLSPLASDLVRARASSAYQKLVVRGPTPADAQRLLADVSPEQLLAVPVASYPHACAMLAGLWLWHDGLHECHAVAQKSPEDLRPPGTLLAASSAPFLRERGLGPVRGRRPDDNEIGPGSFPA